MVHRPNTSIPWHYPQLIKGEGALGHAHETVEAETADFLLEGYTPTDPTSAASILKNLAVLEIEKESIITQVGMLLSRATQIGMHATEVTTRLAEYKKRFALVLRQMRGILSEPVDRESDPDYIEASRLIEEEQQRARERLTGSSSAGAVFA